MCMLNVIIIITNTVNVEFLLISPPGCPYFALYLSPGPPKASHDALEFSHDNICKLPAAF